MVSRTKGDGDLGHQIHVFAKPYTCFTLLSPKTADDILSFTLCRCFQVGPLTAVGFYCMKEGIMHNCQNDRPCALAHTELSKRAYTS